MYRKSEGSGSIVSRSPLPFLQLFPVILPFFTCPFSMYHKTWPSESCCDHHNLSENVKFSDIFYMSSRLKADFFNIKEGFSPQISAIFGNLGRDIPLNLWIRLLAPPQIVMARRISYPRQLSANSAVTFSLPLHRKYPAPS